MPGSPADRRRPPAPGGSGAADPPSTSGARDDAWRKAEWVKALHRLEQRLRVLEQGTRYKVELAVELRPVEGELVERGKERETVARALASQLQAVQGSVRRLQSLLAGVEEGEAFVEALAATMEKAEAAVGEMKDSQRVEYDALAREEALLSREIDLMQRRFDAPGWGEPSPSPGPAHGPDRPPQRARSPAARGAGAVHPDVQAFADFLDMHGPTGGWHPEDHAEWVRILALSKRDWAVAVEVACEEMVGMGREAIVAHARWHAEFEDLAFRKRAAIASWRVQVDCQKDEQMLQAAMEVAQGELREEAQAAQRAELDRRRRAAQREAVAEWRASSRQAQEEERRREEEEAERRRQAERAARLARQRANRAALAERRALADAQSVPQTPSRDSGSPSTSASGAPTPSAAERRAELFERHRRNLALVQERQAMIERKAEAAQLREQRALSLAAFRSVVAPRDPERLLKKTVACLARDAAEREQGGLGNVRHIQRRAIPAWRRGADG